MGESFIPIRTLVYRDDPSIRGMVQQGAGRLGHAALNVHCVGRPTSTEMNVATVTLSGALRTGDIFRIFCAGPRDLHTGRTLQISWGRHSWMGEGIQQDAGAVGPVATIRGAELGVGGDEHAGWP